MALDFASDEDFEFSVNENENEDDSDFEFDREIDENVAPSSKKLTTNKGTKKTTTTATAKKKKVPVKKGKATTTKRKTVAKKVTKKIKTIDLDSDSDNNDELMMNDDDMEDEEEPTEVLTERSNKKKKDRRKSKTVEQIYQKKTQLEHILLRPDTYIGSVEPHTQEMWVYNNPTNNESETTDKIIQKNITYTPGLYKIYDEILVNAADNKQRDENMDKLEINIDAPANLISVKNNGKGIPVVMHKEHQCYVPTLIFGHLLTGSNFDDDEKKTTGGRNGYGAKLANIFSTKFIVECVDTKNNIKFYQEFHNNMSKALEPKLKTLSNTEKKRGDYVKISFSPDLKRFQMDVLDDDTVSLLSKRAYDIAGSMANKPGKKLSVTLNGTKVPVRNFQSYLNLYKGIERPAAFEQQVGGRWEVGVGVSDGSFQQISFVNSICTSKGGQHVSYIADQVAKRLAILVNKKNKGGVLIKENQMKNHLCIFVNCLIENPAFDSQTKENMITRKNDFGSKCELSDKFMKQVEKSGVVTNILAFAKFKQNQALSKKGGVKRVKLTGIAKLDDANCAGTAKSKNCTLILTEGDSAKSLAMSGLSVVGRDMYGVFPLKGKLLNVREATHKQIMGNDEIKNIVDIMGLKFGVVYDETNIKSLRYGHLMIMADQDYDGSHIKGLVINFIHHFWPSLLDIKGFLQQFITPIVKVTKGKNNVKTFFTVPEYEEWKDSTGNDGKGWNIKYYKGLGTSTSAEAKEYFSNLDLHEITFAEISTDDVVFPSEDVEFSDDSEEQQQQPQPPQAIVPDKIASGSSLIDMAFSKKHVESRKDWLNNLEQDTYLNYSAAQDNGIKYSDFINKELILFSQYDNKRSLPHVFDGFKPSQRKVLFACFLKNMKTEMKVAQFSGYVGEKSAYHHGEASLQGTIINMAQDFVGSNNVNLLTPAGQFGTRRMGGKDCASPRYIYTKVEKITRTIFHPDDDALLKYLNDDGQSIEPDFYMPVIPLLLVNGSEGIGTGWSTNIPNFNPRHIINNIRNKLNGEPMQKMHPDYFGFTGSIEADPKKKGSYTVSGKIERVDDTTLFISELPLKKWTQDYKVFLEGMLEKPSSGTKEAEIKDFKENHTDTTIAFTITATKEKIDEFEKSKGGLFGKFKLTSTLNTNNMHLFDSASRIVKFDSPEAVLDYFCEKRLTFYVKRKEHMLKNLRREQSILSNKARFVEEVCTGELIVSNRKRDDILAQLKDRGYELFPKQDDKTKAKDGDEDDSESDEDIAESTAELVKGYEYLLGMKIWSLTFEKAEKLRKELAEKTRAVAELEAKTPNQIWESDLTAIEDAMDDRDVAYAEAAAEECAAQNKNKKHQAGKKKATRARKPKKAVKKEEVNSDSEFLVGKARKTVAAPRVTKASRAKTKSEDVDSDSEFLVGSKGTTKKSVATAAAKPDRALAPIFNKKATANEPLELESDSDDEEEVGLSLMDRMREKLVVSPPRNVPSSSKITVTTTSSQLESSSGKKRPSPKDGDSIDDSLDSFQTETYEPASLTPAPKRSKKGKKITKAKATKKSASSESDDEMFDEDIPVKETKKVAKKKGQTTKKKVTKKKTTVDILSSDEESFNEDILSDDDSEVEIAPQPVARRGRSQRQRKTVVYNLDDSDGDSDSDFSM